MSSIDINNRIYGSTEFTEFVKEHETILPFLDCEQSPLNENGAVFLIIRSCHVNRIKEIHIDDFEGYSAVYFYWLATNSDGVDDWVMDRILPGDFFIEVY